MPFRIPLDLEVGSEIVFLFGIELYKIKKMRSKIVLRRIIFVQWIFDVKMKGLNMVKARSSLHVLFQFKRFRWVTKFNEKWTPEWHQQIINSSPWVSIFV